MIRWMRWVVDLQVVVTDPLSPPPPLLTITYLPYPPQRPSLPRSSFRPQGCGGVSLAPLIFSGTTPSDPDEWSRRGNYVLFIFLSPPFTNSSRVMNET